ncbi:retinoblastoma-like protein 1 [Clavelina lepadiformis]|uniref:retinoblastoma-like protein 1 n=1 Tax=Clavelina lepadiformis TaxID=159417 RepID=UPI0040422B4E
MNTITMENEDEEVEQRFRDLCLAVNMDKPTMELAWKAYETTKTNYTLEGDTLHWLVCALYSACRRNLPIMKSVSGQSLPSNCVSLTILLREAKFSFISFLKKMDKWLQMNNSMSIGPLADHVASLDRSFRVSTVVFKKYRLVFKHVFLDPDDPRNQPHTSTSTKNPSRPHRSRRHRKVHCTPRDIFNFCWTLFIHAKGAEYRSVSDELVSSFQLLLSVIDLCFKNALNCDHRTSLLNPEFPGLPKGWEQIEFKPAKGDVDIIALLVGERAALQLSRDETEQFLLQSKVVYIHNWKKFVTSLLDPNNEILIGEETTLFHPVNYDANSKTVNKLYEEFVLTEGDFDERVFLCDDVDRELGTPIKCPPAESRMEQLKREVNEHLAESTVITPKTPLTNRHYLEGKHNNGSMTPVSTAMQAVLKLKNLLQLKRPAASDKLVAIFKEGSENPATEIEERLSKLGETFKSEYMKQYGEIPPSSEEFAEIRLTMSKTLYYHTLERTMMQEKKRMKNINGDLTGLLKRDDFHNLLFACCVEIILCANKSPRLFPWILDALNLSPYYFYKVIELVVRSEENLPGPCVKHLNHVEEQILETLAWKSDSPLWEAVKKEGCPMCEEVNFPQHVENGVDKPAMMSTSALAHPRIKAVADGEVSFRKSDGGSARDRFSSPSAGSAKRRLFIPIITEPVHPDNPATLNNDAENKPPTGNEKERPKRVGSLALFFRKVYHMASVRLRDLCEQLTISSNLQSKIWTCFEHSVAKWAFELMRDRHIDQLLMCSVYVMAKITQHDQSFQEIMQCYRSQPQAASSVYRSVMIQRSSTPLPVASRHNLRSSSSHLTSSSQHSPTTPTETRADLIQFYNQVYIPKMRDFVKKFNPDVGQVLTSPLSPMPRRRSTPQSPRRVSNRHNIYVSPMKTRAPFMGVASQARIEYNFQRSPAKNLRDINTMMQRHGPVINLKRSLAFSGLAGQDEVAHAKRQLSSKKIGVPEQEKNGTN